MSDRKNPDFKEIKRMATNKRRGSANNVVPPKSALANKIRDILKKGKLMVQEYHSAASSGRASHKYSTKGTRQFVPFLYDEVTVENIKSACHSYFSSKDPSIGPYCDLLVAAQGPSVQTLDDLNLNLINVRFVADLAELGIGSEDDQLCAMKSSSSSITEKRKRVAPSCTASTVTPSLSLSKMMRIGNVVREKRLNIEIEIESFDISEIVWRSHGTVSFLENPNVVGRGNFRTVTKITSSDPMFSKNDWALKRYRPSAIQKLTDLKNTAEEHTRKAVQMTCLAKHLAKKLSEQNSGTPKFHYGTIYFGKIGDEYVTLEPFLNGDFEKYMNNDGKCGLQDTDVARKAECLAHFSFETTNGKLLLTDIQGVGMELSDPEIASEDIKSDDGKNILFCIGNCSRPAIKNFGISHKCNDFCKFAFLTELDADEFNNYDDKVNL